ncbi:MAG: transglutaminase-like domain-containing protein [Armatimonadota bacterium]
MSEHPHEPSSHPLLVAVGHGLLLLFSALLLLYVLPAFGKVVDDAGGTLPVTTQRLLHLAHWLRHYAPLMIPLAGVVLWLDARCYTSLTRCINARAGTAWAWGWVGVLTLLFPALIAVGLPGGTTSPVADPSQVLLPRELETAVMYARENGGEIRRALAQASTEEKPDVEFLIRNMPLRDLTTLSADYLLENVRYARKARQAAPWAQGMPEGCYENYVLPYASVTERREAWRKEFYQRFLPVVKGCRHPGEAAVKLNGSIFKQLHVQYHATRPVRPDQGPLESVRVGYASCTGLSILLVDACRAVGVPARLAGVAHWTGVAGNHTWVEVWDNGWHCLGAAESPALDQAWFTKRAGQADPVDPLKHIYAVSFQRVPLRFPLAWNPYASEVSAVDVTAWYRERFGHPRN